MPTTQTLLQFPQRFTDNAGNPLSGGSLTFSVAGSATPQNTYSDQALTVLNDNPLSLNAAGYPIVSNTEVKIYPLAAAYKIIVKDSGGTTIHTWDNVEPNAPWNLQNGATGLVLTSPTITGGTITGATNVSPIITTSIISSSALLAGICQGRLTLTTAVPVTTSDVTAATTVYFTPYLGSNISLYDGSSKWTLLPFTEISIALGTLTSGLPYDIFAFNNSGIVALRSPVAWTNGTTRATALMLQNGIYVKTGATTDRYLGSFYTTATTTTEDSYAKRNLWNYYNRVERPMRVVEATDSWTYTTATYRQARGTATNQLEFMLGVAEVLVHGQVTAFTANSQNDASSQIYTQVSIGEDSTSTPDALVNGIGNAPQTAGSVVASFGPRNAWLQKYPAAGRHLWVSLERSTATGTTTWYGDNGDSTLFQAGIFGSLMG